MGAGEAEFLDHVNLIAAEVREQCRGELPAPCEAACPLHLDVRQYTTLIAQGRFKEALGVVKQKLPFPGIIGRICTRPCELACRRKDVDSPIAICDLKRFVADYGSEDDESLSVADEKKEAVAVIGGGPAGLIAAHDLRRLGYQVTIFEGTPELGGLLYAGIPEYRLPHDLLKKEIALIYALGITVRLNTWVGKQITFDKIRKDFSAVFLATGKQAGRKLHLPGEELAGVHYGISLLPRLRQGEKIDFGKRVIVIGGGNVAMDAARSAWRAGAEAVTLLYRRSRAEMPALPEEIEEAEREGVHIHYLTAPARIMGKEGKVSGVEYLRVMLGPPDEDGRKRPLLLPNSSSFLEADSVIIAAGQEHDPSFLSETFGLKVGPQQDLPVHPVTLATEMEGVFAGGDMASGEATAINALATGRRAAFFLDRYLRGEAAEALPDEGHHYETPFLKPITGITTRERVPAATIAVPERQGNFRETTVGFNEPDALREAGRCLDCQCRACVTDCEFLKKYGLPRELAGTFQKQLAAGSRTAYSCNVCGLCAEVCPEKIDTGKLCLAVREKLVSDGQGPLPEHQAVKNTQEFVLSDAFRFVHPGPGTGKCQRVFFPGCSLSGYAPDLVVASYRYLLERDADTGIILGCCGGPNHFIGQQTAFHQIITDIEANMRELGAQEMIVACPDCSRTLKENLPGLPIKSLYEVMVEAGLPEGITTGEPLTFSIHDSCTARHQPRIRDSVRHLLREMGYGIEETEYSGEKARCCGMGGMVPYVDFDLAADITKRRAEEFNFDIASYCAGCREAMATNKPSLHVLDLIFNPKWKETRHQTMKTGKKRREGQSQTKALLAKLLKDRKSG